MIPARPGLQVTSPCADAASVMASRSSAANSDNARQASHEAVNRSRLVRLGREVLGQLDHVARMPQLVGERVGRHFEQHAGALPISQKRIGHPASPGLCGSPLRPPTAKRRLPRRRRRSAGRHRTPPALVCQRVPQLHDAPFTERPAWVCTGLPTRSSSGRRQPAPSAGDSAIRGGALRNWLVSQHPRGRLGGRVTIAVRRPSERPIVTGRRANRRSTQAARGPAARPATRHRR